MREIIDLVEATTRPAKLETTPLPYTLRAPGQGLCQKVHRR